MDNKQDKQTEDELVASLARQFQKGQRIRIGIFPHIPCKKDAPLLYAPPIKAFAQRDLFGGVSLKERFDAYYASPLIEDPDARTSDALVNTPLEGVAVRYEQDQPSQQQIALDFIAPPVR